MSVEFTLTGSRLDLDGWNDLLGEWAGSAPAELFEEDLFLDETNDHCVHILGEGSTRGVVLWREDEKVGLRLPALASRLDWRMAYGLARRALEKGGGRFEREDGTVLEGTDLTDDAAGEAAVKDFCFALQMVSDGVKKQGEAQLPVGFFNVTVRGDDLPDRFGPDVVAGVEDRLSARVARYATAYRASTMILTGNVRLSTWARIPTLVFKPDLVAVQGLEDPVPAARLLALLGERAEKIGEHMYFLPELDDGADADALLAAIGEETVDVEAWIAEHGDPDAPGADEDAEADADDAQVARIAPVLGHIIGRVLEQSDPDTIREELGEIGVPPDVADQMMGLVALALQALKDESGGMRGPEEVMRILGEQGVPPTLARAVIAAFLTVADDDGGGNEEGE